MGTSLLIIGRLAELKFNFKLLYFTAVLIPTILFLDMLFQALPLLTPVMGRSFANAPVDIHEYLHNHFSLNYTRYHYRGNLHSRSYFHNTATDPYTSFPHELWFFAQTICGYHSRGHRYRKCYISLHQGHPKARIYSAWDQF